MAYGPARFPSQRGLLCFCKVEEGGESNDKQVLLGGDCREDDSVFVSRREGATWASCWASWLGSGVDASAVGPLLLLCEGERAGTLLACTPARIGCGPTGWRWACSAAWAGLPF